MTCYLGRVTHSIGYRRAPFSYLLVDFGRSSRCLVVNRKRIRKVQVTMNRKRSCSVGSTVKKIAVVSEFLQQMGGKRVIQRILIANNGMAATKAILSIRQWSYMVLGDERVIEFVAMATKDDLNANAEFIRLADTYVEVPSGSNKVSLRSKILFYHFPVIN